MNRSYFYKDNLESPRLVTRFLNKEDVKIWEEFFMDDDAIRYIPVLNGVKSNNIEKSKAWIDRQLNRYSENRLGLQALIHKETNTFIGQCGLLKQEINGSVEIEVGYHVFKKYWGQGFAPEAARLFIDFAFENNLANSVISISSMPNKD